MKMKDKFDKYWGDPEKMNFIIFFANILDPTNKLEYMEFSLVQIFGLIRGGSFFASVKFALTKIYLDYAASYQSVNVSGSQS